MAPFGIGSSGARWFKSGGRGMATWRLDGIELVSSRINAELMKMKGKSARGLVLAARNILNDAEVTVPRVPVLTGTLRNSTFATPIEGTLGEPYVLFGYKTNYAAAVHEMLYSVAGKPIDWTRPGSGPKWFEASIKRNEYATLRIVAANIEIR